MRKESKNDQEGGDLNSCDGRVGDLESKHKHTDKVISQLLPSLESHTESPERVLTREVVNVCVLTLFTLSESAPTADILAPLYALVRA